MLLFVERSYPRELCTDLLSTYSQVYNTHELERRQSNSDCQKKSLLHLAESLWALELERTSYLILLLIVLFSTQVPFMAQTFSSGIIQNLAPYILFSFH